MFTLNSMFEKGTYNLRPEAKAFLKDFLKDQALSGLNGYTPNPDGPFPFPGPCPYPLFSKRFGPPWPEPCLHNNFLIDRIGYPAPDGPDDWPWPIGPLVRNIRENLILEQIRKAPIRKETYNLLDAIKRENLAYEAYDELSNDLQVFQKNIDVKLKILG